MSDKQGKIVWQNECRLVFSGNKFEQQGSMGLNYPEDRRGVMVDITEHGGKNLMDQLRGASVRITIETVEGGDE